jgi:hypothetical protein
MNPADILFNGISSIPNFEKNKIINLDELMNNNINNKKDYSSDKYSSQNRQIIVDKKISYQIFNKNNSKNAIANLVYIGKNYFITILNKDQHNTLCRFPNNYYVNYITKKLNILLINTYHNNIENNYVILILQVDSNDDIINEFDIINPSMYLSYEQKNVIVSYESNSSIQTTQISNISDNYITINNDDAIMLGSPLFVNNILIGIYYRKSANVCFFYRISGLYNWLNTFSLITKNRVIEQALYIPYSKDQMYRIILSMNDRINLLEQTISKIKND